MKALNQLFNSSCIPKCESYKKITEDIILIDNFFGNFSSARDFFINRDKWKCVSYQDHAKPGDESVFPKWIGKSLMEKYIFDNKITDIMCSYDIVCNFFYKNSDFLWSLTNSIFFPHYDSIKKNDILTHICLINLNLIPVTTKFYTFQDKNYCDVENESAYQKYVIDIEKELFEYYDKKNITRDEVKTFLDSKKELNYKLWKEIKYEPNQAIIYPANLFHSADVPSEFSEDNPRVILRISFDAKTKKILNYF